MFKLSIEGVENKDKRLSCANVPFKILKLYLRRSHSFSPQAREEGPQKKKLGKLKVIIYFFVYFSDYNIESSVKIIF